MAHFFTVSKSNNMKIGYGSQLCLWIPLFTVKINFLSFCRDTKENDFFKKPPQTQENMSETL